MPINIILTYIYQGFKQNKMAQRYFLSFLRDCSSGHILSVTLHPLEVVIQDLRHFLFRLVYVVLCSAKQDRLDRLRHQLLKHVIWTT